MKTWDCGLEKSEDKVTRFSEDLVLLKIFKCLSKENTQIFRG